MSASCSLLERLEDDDLVDPVQELGPEVLAHLLGRADVRGHDQDGVAEVDRAALAVGEAAVVEHLQQHVEDLAVRLLDLVEQDDRVRAPAHGLGQLAALVVADVAGRRADQARHRVPLLVLGHVDPDHRPLVVEHELGERAGELGLADAGRAEEDERADRPVGILEPGAGAAKRVRDGLDRRVLADHALVQALLHVDQLLGLALEQARDGDARPRGDDGGDVVLVDLLLHHRLGRRVALRELLLERGQLAVADLGDALQVAGALGALGLHPQLVDPRRDLADPVERALLLGPAGGELRRGAPSRRRAAARPARARPSTPCPSPRARSRAAARRGRPGRARAASCRSPSSAATRPRRRGRSPCPGSWRSAM